MLEMIKIPAAGQSFWMGNQGTTYYSQGLESPVHTVSFTKNFYIGKYEVTQAQWLKIFGKWPETSPSLTYGAGENYPAYEVSWDDICSAGGFLEKINALSPSGHSGFRLPTEAEWEYSARAGTYSLYGVDVDINEYAWHAKNSGLKTHPVGEKLSNAFGLYDMSGNVLEWCSDWYGSYNSADVIDPTGPASGFMRVLRGGACGYHQDYCRSAARHSFNSYNRRSSGGFRLALTASQ